MTNKTVKTTKANNTNKLMLTGKGKLPKRTKTEVINALVSELTAPASAPVTPAPTPIAAIAEPVSKRITVGAKIDQWRVVRSQRASQPGWFLQGGSYQMLPNGRNAFVCGHESHHTEKSEAYAALAKQSPAAA